MLLQTFAQDVHYLTSNSVQIKGAVRITVHAAPLGLLVHAVNKHIFAVSDIGTGKVLLSQVVRVGGQNSNLAVFAHDGLSERYLQQGAGENHLGHCGSQSLLIKCIETAAGGDSLYTLSGQFLTYSDILIQQLLARIDFNCVHVCTLNVYQRNIKGIGLRVGAVSGKSFQLHQNIADLIGVPAQQGDFGHLFHNK